MTPSIVPLGPDIATLFRTGSIVPTPILLMPEPATTNNRIMGQTLNISRLDAVPDSVVRTHKSASVLTETITGSDVDRDAVTLRKIHVFYYLLSRVIERKTITLSTFTVQKSTIAHTFYPTNSHLSIFFLLSLFKNEEMFYNKLNTYLINFFLRY